MATYKKSDRFGAMQLYKPDYGFLTQAYGTRQAQYDRGFNQVKSLYNSVLNSPVTNENNSAFREDAFKKLQESLKSTSNMDLAVDGNVSSAMKMIDPISQDRELAYDMAVTKYHGKQKQRMESYRNSDDPKKRAQYNEYSKMAIQFAEEDLKNATRGNGSIQQIQPAEFVPFEDVNEYLNKAAKEQGLSIKSSGPDGRGYIITEENGKNAVMPFSYWAAQQMGGGRFDRQFALMGKVQAETAIRSKMKNEGLSRTDAINSVASAITPGIIEDKTTEGVESTNSLKTVQNEIAIYEKAYKNGIPESQPHLKEQYDRLVAQEQIYKDEMNGSMSEVGRLRDEGAEYVANNLASIYTQEAKKQTAMSWGATKAMSTSSIEYKADSTWMGKQNLALKKQMNAWNQKMDVANLDLNREKVKLGYAKLAASGSGGSTTSGGKKGEAPNEEYTGVFTSKEHIKKVDLLAKDITNSRNDMFKGITRAGDGLINLIIDEKDYNSTVYAINKVKAIANGGNDKLNAEEMAVLKHYGNKLGHDFKTENWNDQRSAQIAIEAISVGTFAEAQKVLPSYARSGTLPDKVKNVDAFNKTLAAIKTSQNSKDIIDRSVKNVNAVLVDNQGNLKDQYEGAKIKDYTVDGTPVWDLTGMNEAAQEEVGKVISLEYDKLQAPTGKMYDFNNPNGGEIEALFNSNISESLNPELAQELRNLPPAQIKELFSENMRVAYSPTEEIAHVTLRIDPSSSIAKTLDMDNMGVINFKLPYKTIKANTASLGRFAKYIGFNQASEETAGEFSDFVNNPMSRITAPDHVKAMDFDYDVAGVYFDHNGQDTYGLNIQTSYYDPTINQYVTKSKTVPVDDPSNPLAFNGYSTQMNDIVNNYLATLGQLKSDAMTGNMIPLKTPVLQ